MGHHMKFWYVKDLGVLGKYMVEDDLVYSQPKLYNQEKKKWYADKNWVLMYRLKFNTDYLLELKSGSDIHKFEQIDYIAQYYAEIKLAGMKDVYGDMKFDHAKSITIKLKSPILKAAVYLQFLAEAGMIKDDKIRFAFGDRVADLVSLLIFQSGDDYVDDYLWCIADDFDASEIKIVELIYELEKDYACLSDENVKRIQRNEGALIYLIDYWDLSDNEEFNIWLSEVLDASSEKFISLFIEKYCGIENCEVTNNE